MKRHPHVLSGNKTTDLPQFFLVVDTETEERGRIDSGVIHKLKLGCAIWFTLKSGSKKKNEKEIYFFTNNNDFWNWFASHLRNKQRIIFSAHNLGFDFTILDSLSNLKRLGFKMKMPIVTGTRFMGKAKREGQSIWFIDTMNYIPVSLATLGKSLGIEKMEMPKGDDSNEQWKTYCQRDTEILETFWRQLLSFLKTNDLGSFGQTAASLSFNSFRHRFMDFPIFIHNQSSAITCERNSYYGGRTECFRLGSFSNSRFYLLDINSMYPFVMASYPYPTRLVDYRNILPIKELEKLINDHSIIANVGIETNIPVYPKRDEGKLTFPIGRFTTFLTHGEILFALVRGHIRFITNACVYERENIFLSFVNFFYKQRSIFKSEGNTSFALFSKLIMNSLYGKFGQRGHERTEFKKDPTKALDYEQIYSQREKQFYNIYYWDGVGYIEKEEGESFNSFPAISACVTGYARIYLWTLIERVGRNNVFYCDTDSLIVNYNGLNRLYSYIDNNTLGKLKIEGVTDQLTIRGLKDYSFGDKEHIKGVSSKAIMLSSGIFEQIHFATLRESIRHSMGDGVILSKVRKELKRNYDKGLVSPEGFVSPFVLKEF